MKIPKRMAAAVIAALRGGVVPRVGLKYIAVGREREIEALLRDIEVVSDGGASFRFLSGRYGSGKSFLLQTIRGYAMERDFVVCDADLSPERRLQGSSGQGLATYRELMKNLSTKTKPDGGALTLVLDRFLSALRGTAAAEKGLALTDPALNGAVWQKLYQITDSLSDLVHGFDFAAVLQVWCRAALDGDDEKKGMAVKWLRGEYPNKSEAKRDLSVNACISDDDWYDYLKIFAVFLRLAGYHGLIVLLDELVNLYKIPQTLSREKNYEKILTMYNDTMQGKAQSIGFVLCGTPQCIEDPRRGLFSYEALRSRLDGGKFDAAAPNLHRPVIPLEPLSYSEMRILVEKLAEIHAVLYDYTQIVTASDMDDFIKVEYGRIGADSNLTPREVIRDFISLLDIVEQNPQQSAAEILRGGEFAFALTSLEEQQSVPEEYAEFDI